MSAASAIRVLVVEDEPWFRESLRGVLDWKDSGTSHAASAASGEEALSHLSSDISFDVALVDLGLPDMPGHEVIRAIRNQRPATSCVALTVFDDSPTILQAIRAGAHGYLLKSSSVEHVLAGIRAAAEGGAPMTPSIARVVVDALRDYHGAPAQADHGFDLLTRRERDVLAMLAKGMSYEETGDALGIRLGTVQGHVKRIYRKLQVCSKAEAAALAQRVGLI